MRHETRVIAVAAFLASSLLFLRAWAANVEDCKYASSPNKTYTAASPLSCDDYTFYGSRSAEYTPAFVWFLGGEHTVAGTFKTFGLCTVYSAVAELMVSNATISANNVTAQARTGSFVTTTDGIPMRTNVRLVDGAKILSAVGYNIISSEAYEPHLYLDDATVECASGAFSLAASGYASTNYLQTANSTIRTPLASFKVGSSAAVAQSSAQILACTNTTFVTPGLNFVYSSMQADFVNCDFSTPDGADLELVYNTVTKGGSAPMSDVRFKGCTFRSVSAEKLGAHSGGANVDKDRVPRLVFDGGKIKFSKFNVGGAFVQSHMHVILTNNVDVSISQDSLTVCPGNATSRLDVAGTSLVVTNILYVGWSMGSVTTTPTAAGILNVCDGADLRIDHSTIGAGGGSLYVGTCTPGFVTLHDGSISARSIVIGSNLYDVDVSAATYEFRQMGGVVTNNVGDGSGGTVVAANKKSHATLELNGGRYETVQIKGGAGESTLLANGGTVVRGNRFQNVLMQGLTHAKVGPKGLTLETPSRIVVNVTTTISQAFENMEGAEGEIRKTGVGVLNITTPDADWNVTRTVAREGTLMVANDTRTLGGTEVVTTNTGILSVQGDGFSDGLTVKGLALCGGAIALDDGEVVTVTNSFRATAATAIQFQTTTALGAEVKAIVLAKGVTLSTETLKALAQPSATGRTTARGRPLVGKLFVKPGADDTQEIWYTVIKQPSGFVMMLN